MLLFIDFPTRKTYHMRKIDITSPKFRSHYSSPKCDRGDVSCEECELYLLISIQSHREMNISMDSISSFSGRRPLAEDWYLYPEIMIPLRRYSKLYNVPTKKKISKNICMLKVIILVEGNTNLREKSHHHHLFVAVSHH